MALIGKIEEYHKKDSWIEYTERLEQYFAADEITDNNKKRAVLLSVCGAKTYKLIRNLVNPRKPTDKSFVELVNLVKNHLNPRPSSIVYRFKFNSRFRLQGETIQQYVTELRNLSEHCDFGDQLEKMLRDRLVCRLNDERIQRRLLAESQVEFKRAMELVTAMEITDRNTRDLIAGNLSEKPKESQVNCVTQDPPKQLPKQPPRDPKRSTKECYRCGGQFHDPDKCRYKDEECYKCRKKGHKASQCLGKHKAEFQKSGKFGNTHHLEATDESGEEECEEYTMFHINTTEREPFRVVVECCELCNRFFSSFPVVQWDETRQLLELKQSCVLEFWLVYWL
ncbi:uncharacterized protein LOC110047679 [Orbicella faveolata]|uniref:uncharacterized protein LOC110047679 n=1 Tax=Orbicella faveolata TaxID=48498 RepID=UPI0009E57011|nr:uncharacterized protein LOC110047679 [Orbicella faveolata]